MKVSNYFSNSVLYHNDSLTKIHCLKQVCNERYCKKLIENHHHRHNLFNELRIFIKIFMEKVKKKKIWDTSYYT